jgi:hypothetical protein
VLLNGGVCGSCGHLHVVPLPLGACQQFYMFSTVNVAACSALLLNTCSPVEGLNSYPYALSTPLEEQTTRCMCVLQLMSSCGLLNK